MAASGGGPPPIAPLAAAPEKSSDGRALSKAAYNGQLPCRRGKPPPSYSGTQIKNGESAGGLRSPLLSSSNHAGGASAGRSLTDRCSSSAAT